MGDTRLLSERDFVVPRVMIRGVTFNGNEYGDISRPRCGIGRGTRMYASGTARSVSEKSVNDRTERKLPCSLEEVVLNSPQKIFTYLVLAEIIDITKAVEMRKVIGFVEHFFPIGLIVGASRPLGDAALDLMTTCTTRQKSRAEARKDSISPQ